MEINTSVFEAFPLIKTRRLTLRAFEDADAAGILAMRSSGRVNQFIARDAMGRYEDAVQLLDKTRMAFQNRQGIGWAGVLRDGQSLIGSCGYNSIDYNNLRAEIGGEMSVEYWGKHIALEAVAAIVYFGLHTMNLHSIEAKVSPLNRGAISLLEHLGFVKEAHFTDRIYHKGSFSDMAVYSLIKGRENANMKELFLGEGFA